MALGLRLLAAHGLVELFDWLPAEWWRRSPPLGRCDRGREDAGVDVVEVGQGGQVELGVQGFQL